MPKIKFKDSTLKTLSADKTVNGGAILGHGSGVIVVSRAA